MFVSSMSGPDDVSISGFKDAITEQNATEATTVQEQEEAVSPDTVSATSQSTDDPTKDTVSCQTVQCLQVYVKIYVKLTSSCPPGVGAGTESAVGVCGHGGGGREHRCGSGGGPGHAHPAGQHVSQAVPQQPQSG